MQSTQDEAQDSALALAALLQAASKGDEQAWRSIVDLYARRVFAMARSRLGGLRAEGPFFRGSGNVGGWASGNDAAEEVTQSVFCTIASKLAGGEYTEKGRFESWLFRVAMNRVRDEVRRRKRHATPTDPETLSGVSAAASVGSSTDTDEISRLRLAMENLMDSDREVVELRHHAGLSFKQISEMVDEPVGTLLARHHRALKKLKDLMSETPDILGERA